MTVIYAKLKRDNNSNVILFNEPEQGLKDLFDQTNLGNSIEYNYNGEQLSDDELYYVKLSDSHWDTIEEQYRVNNDATVSVNDNGYSNEYDKIDVIYQVTDKSIAFKKITAKHLISDKGWIRLDGTPKFEVPCNKITIDGLNTLYIDKEKKYAYFKNFRNASGVIHILKEFYMEATQEEVDEMVSHDIFKIVDLDTKKIGERNRKNIAYITKELKINLSDQDIINKIKKYATKYNQEIFTDGKLKITTNSDLSKVLEVISGAFFSNEITGDIMKATSMKKYEK